MKRFYIITLAAITCFAVSCNKIDTPVQNVSAQEPTVDFTITDLGGQDTKAVKTGWENGDKINVWFHSAYTTILNDYDYAPDLVLTKTDSGWSPKFRTSFSTASLAEDIHPYLFYVYEGHNNLNDYYTAYFESAFACFDGHSRGCPLMAGGKAACTYDSTENKVTAALDQWEFVTRIQIVVEGLDNERNKFWSLGMINVKEPGYGNLLPPYGFKLWGSYNEFVPMNETNEEYGSRIPGVPNEDGQAFYFSTSTKEGETAQYCFNLILEQYGSKTVYSCTKTVKIEVPQNGMVAYKIKQSDFDI